MPWEGKENKKLAKGIPYSYQWAYDPNGVNQCGCICTVQGFAWIGRRESSKDPMLKRANVADFTSYAKNVYRVLLTRGMQGCYVHFLDKNTHDFFQSRMSRS